MHRLRIALFALVTVVVLGASHAFGAETSTAAAPAAVVEGEPLVYFNRTLFVFRAPILGYSPHQRAVMARAQLEHPHQRGGDGTVAVKPIPEGFVLEVDGWPAFRILPGDVNQLANEKIEELAETTRVRVQEAMDASRESRTAGSWARPLLRAAIATVIWLVALRILMAAKRWTARRFSALLEKSIDKVRAVRLAGVRLDKLRAGVLRLVGALSVILGLFLTYLWLTFALEQFPYTRPWGEHLEVILVDLLLKAIGVFVHAFPGLIVVVLIFFVTRALANALDAFFVRVERGQLDVLWIDRETVRPTRRIAIVVLWLFALAMAYPYLPGSNSEAFKGLSVLVGVMISLGGAGIVGQLLSGISLMYQRALRVGEFVRIGEVEGTVVALGFMRTTIHTGTGEEVSLPNSSVVSSAVRNLSRLVPGSGFILNTTVTIGYDAPWRQVHAMLLEAADRTSGILDDPKPYVVQTALSDFYVEYKLVARAGPEAPRMRAEAMSALHANIQDVFNEHGVQIMSPHYLGDPADAKVVPKERWFEAPATKQAPGEEA